MSSKRYSKEQRLEMLERYKNGESAGSIAKSFGCYTQTVLRVLRRNGVKIRKCAGKDHHMWKGGRISKGDGYIGVWMPGHERADKQGYVFEHTLVIEQKYGRLPTGEEQIHHINGDKTDNRPENLYLCKSSKEHKAAHWSFEKHLKHFLDNDIIEFVNGKYELK